ncbi:hypothetical protein BJ322DRAFT_98762 [Thelephora terrestris]|uniref:Uncharacterized protein n=1 Tax=Thelephora terrestris TaxID=56493 RepID=A0A9P6LCZ0_9AGAM|nr:hypothetical protein BJ322DRAFT_98762 [Thelephora terrestris]
MIPRGAFLWIYPCWTHANHCGRSGQSGLEEDRSLESDNFVTWHGAAGHICRRWAYVRSQRSALSAKEGIEAVGGVYDVALHPQNRCSFEAGKRSVISTSRPCPFQAESKQQCELRLDKSRLHECSVNHVAIERGHTESSPSEP